MGDSEVPSESTPGPPTGGSSSSPPSLSPGSWVQPVTGAVVLLVVIGRLVPLLDRFATEAQKIQQCGWEKWIPTMVVTGLILGGLVPTAYRDLAALGTALKGLMPGGNGKK